jgi:hypothetical protein
LWKVSTFCRKNLVRQCVDLVEKFHALQSYRCLPDMLWRFGLGPMIEHNRSFKKLLDKASRSRSAKTVNENFVRITTTILALEILASSFVGWSSLFPEAAKEARDFFKRNTVGRHTPLMDCYVYPPNISIPTRSRRSPQALASDKKHHRYPIIRTGILFQLKSGRNCARSLAPTTAAFTTRSWSPRCHFGAALAASNLVASPMAATIAPQRPRARVLRRRAKIILPVKAPFRSRRVWRFVRDHVLLRHFCRRSQDCRTCRAQDDGGADRQHHRAPPR